MSAWYALSVTTRCEQSAARDLLAHVDELFLPVRRQRRPWSDRIVTAETPLFPGYLFVRTAMSAAKRVQMLKSKFVNDLVGRRPGDPRIAQPVDAAEVEALKVVVAAQVSLDPVERLVVGRHVLVAAGPLRGARGVVEQAPDGRHRLVLQIALLGRGVRAVLSAEDVVESLDVAA